MGWKFAALKKPIRLGFRLQTVKAAALLETRRVFGQVGGGTWVTQGSLANKNKTAADEMAATPNIVYMI